MDVVLSGKYLGNKKTELTHEPSGTKFLTDAPVDNQGEGSSFSPTDLLGASIASCIVTIMSITAESKGYPFAGTRYQVTKSMSDNPRRIAKLNVVINLPKALTEQQRTILTRAVDTCPVKRSLHPDVEVATELIFDV